MIYIILKMKTKGGIMNDLRVISNKLEELKLPQNQKATLPVARTSTLVEVAIQEIKNIGDFQSKSTERLSKELTSRFQTVHEKVPGWGKMEPLSKTFKGLKRDLMRGMKLIADDFPITDKNSILLLLNSVKEVKLLIKADNDFTTRIFRETINNQFFYLIAINNKELNDKVIYFIDPAIHQKGTIKVVHKCWTVSKYPKKYACVLTNQLAIRELTHVFREVAFLKQFKEFGVIESKKIVPDLFNAVYIKTTSKVETLPLIDETQLLFMEYFPDDFVNVVNTIQEENDSVKLEYFSDIAYIIQVIHKYNVAYRDLKLENFLIKENGLIALCDWGFASHIDDMIYLLAHPKLGTFQHSSNELIFKPEIPKDLLERKNFLFKIDIFALGVCFYMIFFGMRPWNGNSPDETFRDMIRFQNDELNWTESDQENDMEANPQQMINDLIDRMLDPDANKRPDIDAVIDKIKEIQKVFVEMNL